jgi:hypothetical protein
MPYLGQKTKMRRRLKLISAELKNHAPFTLFGAATGLLCMLLFSHAGPEINLRLFQVFHPGHVILSALVTASLYELYEGKVNFVKILLVGYFGSIGIATLSDCVLPFFGESLMGVAIPVHANLHEHNGQAHHEESLESEASQDPSAWKRLHLGFIEEWYLVNPAALLGVFIAFFLPRTRFPHAGHVLVSTWASSFHVLMNTQRELTIFILFGFFVVLFIAVWLPCCISDIVFPLLFVGKDKDLSQIHHH